MMESFDVLADAAKVVVECHFVLVVDNGQKLLQLVADFRHLPSRAWIEKDLFRAWRRRT